MNNNNIKNVLGYFVEQFNTNNTYEYEVIDLYDFDSSNEFNVSVIESYEGSAVNMKDILINKNQKDLSVSDLKDAAKQICA
jgi:hypothetical protein